MSRSGGYKCYNIRCGSCIGKTLCGEPEDAALGCDNRIVSQITNADRVRAMSDEELADFISRIEIGDFGPQVYGKTFCDMCDGQYECDDCRLWWLRQPAEEDWV